MEEQSILGVILHDNNKLDEINFLNANDFENTSHQRIYSKMLEMYQENKPIDIITLPAALEYKIPPSYFTELYESIATTKNITHHASILQKKAILRRGRETGQKLIELSRQPYDNIDEYITEVESEIEKIKPQVKKGFKKIGDGSVATVDKILDKSLMKTVKTGFYKLDQFTKGLWAGWLFVIGARPGSGKTALALQIAEYVSRTKAVALFEMEMSEHEIRERLIARLGKVNGKSFKDKEHDYSTDEIKSITNAASYMDSLKLYIDDTQGITVDYVISQSRKLKRENPDLSLIIIDYLTMMDIIPRGNELMTHAVGRATRNLKRLARELEVTVLLLSQLKRTEDRPKLSDLRESGEIEQDADVVGFLYNDLERKEITQTEILEHIEFNIAKGRGIGVGKFDFSFNGSYQLFREK